MNHFLKIPVFLFVLPPIRFFVNLIKMKYNVLTLIVKFFIEILYHLGYIHTCFFENNKKKI